MRRFLNGNGPSLAMFILFILALVGQNLARLRIYNGNQRDHDEPTIGYAEYFATDAFSEAPYQN